MPRHYTSPIGKGVRPFGASRSGSDPGLTPFRAPFEALFGPLFGRALSIVPGGQSSLVSQGIDRIHFACPSRWIVAKKNAHCRGKEDRDGGRG